MAGALASPLGGSRTRPQVVVRLEEVARLVLAAHRKGLLTGPQTKAFLERVFAVDSHGRFWTVGARSHAWFVLRDGHGWAATPVDMLVPVDEDETLSRLDSVWSEVADIVSARR